MTNVNNPFYTNMFHTPPPTHFVMVPKKKCSDLIKNNDNQHKYERVELKGMYIYLINFEFWIRYQCNNQISMQ
jgi:hypothetical protein